MTDAAGVSDWTGNNFYWIIKLQMFRQQSQINCNCSLFPPPQVLPTPSFRSPQRPNPHKDHRSKRSLKCHSSSRTKHLAFPSRLANHKLPDVPATPNLSTIASTRVDSRNNAENLFAARSAEEKAVRSIFEMRQSNESVGQNTMSTRAASPLGPYDLNAHKRVTFNYSNDYDFRPVSTKLMASPPMVKEMSNSYLPSGQLRKRQLEQKCAWSKQAIALPVPELAKTPSIECRLPSPENANLQVQQGLRSRTATNVFAMSRLTEMMNEREETESIYEGESAEGEKVEYSRVLISCKKLMEDRNGLLEESAQTRLFDYDERVRAGFKRSGLFDQINIPQR